MAQTKLVYDYTVGSIPKQLSRFMLPLMASNALQVVYSLVDMVIVGRYVGSAGLSGVSQGSMIVLFFVTFCMGFCNSGQIMIAQNVGAGRKDQLNPIIGTLFSVMALFGLVLTVLALAIRLPLIRLISVPPEAKDMAAVYVLICGIGLLFTVGYNAVSAILRGMGDSRHPFIFITLSSVLNLILDLVLTGWLGLGVAGAAGATIFSQAMSFIVSMIFLARHKDAFYFDFKLSSFRIHRELFADMFKLGMPLALQMVAINISMMVCNSFINRLGVAASATFGVGIKIDDIAGKVAMGIQYAAAPMAAQNFGAGKHDRVRRVVYWTWFMSFVIYFVFTVCYVSFTEPIFRLFTSDAAVIELAPIFVRTIIWSFPAMIILRGNSAFLQGTGNSAMLLLFAFLDACARVALGWLLGIVGGSGFRGFVLGFAIAIYCVSVPGLFYFYFAKWEKGKTMVAHAEDP